MIQSISLRSVDRLAGHRRTSLFALVALLGLVPNLIADGPPAPAELPGPLVIVGGGSMPAKVREAFTTLAGKEKAHIVVFSTASGDADDPKEAEGFLKGWRASKPASLVLMHTRNRKTADDPAFVKPLSEATGVWFSGGDQSRITAAYRGTLVEKELRKLHARGVVIGGTSAGAAVMSNPMITGGSEKATTGPGLGFLPGVIVDQHFVARNREKRLAGVIAEHPNYVGIGIDESTAIVCRGKDVEVVGKSTATVLRATSTGKAEVTQIAKPGAHLDLIELRNLAAKPSAK